MQTTSQRNENSRKPCNKRTSRGNVTTSQGDETTRRGCNKTIKVGRGGGLDTALPWVQFDIVQAHNDGGGNLNCKMLTQKAFVDVTNCNDAEQQVGRALSHKEEEGEAIFCFIQSSRVGHGGCQ